MTYNPHRKTLGQKLREMRRKAKTIFPLLGPSNMPTPKLLTGTVRGDSSIKKTVRVAKVFLAQPGVNWLMLVLLFSIVINGIFFVRNKELKAQADTAVVLINPNNSNDVIVLKSELISSETELRKCVVDLMKKRD